MSVLTCLTVLLGALVQDAELVPAGSINGAFTNPPIAFVVEDSPAIVKQARFIQARFFADSRWVDAAEAPDEDLTGHNLIVYGTPDGHGWLKQHADRLPFRFGKNTLDLQEHHFEGKHLKVICALKNPDDPGRRAVVYAAARPADLVEINNVSHGPTEWMVLDGKKVLGSGSFQTTALLTVDQMITDLDYLIEKLEEVHPATVDGRPDELAEAIEYVDIEISEPLRRDAFWFLANRVLLSLHDAHSNLSGTPSGQPLDLPVRWLSDGIVVTRDTKVLRRGDQVLAIGGADEDELLEALSHLVPAETRNWVRHQARKGLTDRAVLDQLGIAPGRGPVEITVLRNGKQTTVQVRPGEVTQAPQEEAPMWVRWKLHEDASLGVFTLDQCNINDVYRNTLREFFEAVHEKGIQRVAIDVRRNGGGNSAVVDEFIRYLDRDDYKSYSAGIRSSEDSRKQSGLRMEDGYTEYGAQTKQNARVEGLPSFTGDLYLLTSAGTFSSANWFATVFQDNGLCKVVGEPTGNAPSAFGDLLRFTLPESSFAFTLSYKKFLRPDPSRDPAGCITPDVLVPTTIQDFLDGRDPVMEYLLALPVDKPAAPGPTPLPANLPDPETLAAHLGQGAAEGHTDLLRQLGAPQAGEEYLGWSHGPLEVRVIRPEDPGPELPLVVLAIGSGGLHADHLNLVLTRLDDQWHVLGSHEVVSHHSLPVVKFREAADRRWVTVRYTDMYGTGIGSQRRDLLEVTATGTPRVASWPTWAECAGWGLAFYRELRLQGDTIGLQDGRPAVTLQYQGEFGSQYPVFADVSIETERQYLLQQPGPGLPFEHVSPEGPMPEYALDMVADGESLWLKEHQAEAERIITQGDDDAREHLRRLLVQVEDVGATPGSRRLRQLLAARDG